MRQSGCILGVAVLTLCVATLACSSLDKRSVSADVAKGAADRWAQEAGWVQYEVGDATFSDGYWSVVVWRVPQTPGGFKHLVISRAGEVVQVLHGY